MSKSGIENPPLPFPLNPPNPAKLRDLEVGDLEPMRPIEGDEYKVLSGILLGALRLEARRFKMSARSS